VIRVIAVLAVAVTAASTAAAIAISHPVAGGVETLPNQLGVLPFAMVGAFLVVRRPAQPVGWLLALCGVCLSLTALVNAHVDAALLPGPGADPTADPRLTLLGNPLSVVGTAAVLVLLPLVYPTGRTVSTRWRWVLRIALLASAAVVVTAPFAEDVLRVGPEGARVDLAPNPFMTVPGAGLAQAVAGIAFTLLLLLVPVSAASLIVRFRRGGVVERQQLRWLGLGLAALVAVVLALLVLEHLLGIAASELVWNTALGSITAMIPLSIAVAITRHGLYEINRVISRALSYALVTIVLAGLYAGFVVVGGAIVRGAAGESSDLVVAASTLAVAAAFRPVRRLVQTGVDRRFNRARYDAAKVLGAFRERLRAGSGMAELEADIVEVVRDTLAPTTVGVWLVRTEAR
jgi:hypothetical protein